MHNLSISKKVLFVVSCCLVGASTLFAQITGKEVYRKYTLKDSSALNKSAVLLLYKDSTFINFGIFDNKKELETFVWYKAGKWHLQDAAILCIATDKSVMEEQLKKQVKQYYRTRPDRVLIETYYEFVHENYRNGSILILRDHAADLEKQLEYSEIKF